MALTDDKGQKIASYEYSPYGQIISKEKKRLVAFLYNGQYGVATDESGLYYMRARYYNVDIKRFMNQDVLTGTLEQISSLNRYAYVEGNPISYLDPFGLERKDTNILHTISSILGIIGTVISFMFPFSGAGNVISIISNTIDIMACVYDLFYDIRDKNIVKAQSDVCFIIIDTVGIVTAGMTNMYKSEAQGAAMYKGIMDGYEWKSGMDYDRYDWYSKLQTAASLVVQALDKLLNE